MKSNVDLSESRIFTTPTPPTDPILLDLLKFLKISKPWDFFNNPIAGKKFLLLEIKKNVKDGNEIKQVMQMKYADVAAKVEAENLGQRKSVIVIQCVALKEFHGNFNL